MELDQYRAEGPIDEDDGVTDGRRPKMFVRFERTSERQSGPMYGPYDVLEVRQAHLVGIATHTEKETAIAELREGKWHLCERRQEPGYLGFSVVFS